MVGGRDCSGASGAGTEACHVEEGRAAITGGAQEQLMKLPKGSKYRWA